MYKKQTKIPTLVALFILLFGIGGGILFVETSTTSTTVNADPIIAPQNIHLTNISDNQFSVSWTTSKETIGYVTYKDANSSTFTALDDRDEDGKPKNYITHHVTVKNLKENTLYNYRINSANRVFDNQGQPYKQITGPRLSSTLVVDPAYGTVQLADDKPAVGSIVYLTVGKSLPLSAIVKNEGTWLIPLNNSRTQDLLSRPQLATPEVIQINVVYDQNQIGTVLTDTKNSSPVPNIIVGKSYDFRNLQGKAKDQLAIEKNTNVLGTSKSITTPTIGVTPKLLQKVDFVFPEKERATTTDTKPLLKGVGIPGKSIVITVNSTPQTGKITVNTDGTWSFIPPLSLPPGEHTINISTVDTNGKPIALSRKFVVLKSGESVLGESTPSATLFPTEVPTEIPIFTVAPSIIASSTPPVTGSLTPTFTFLGMGIIFVLLGLKFLLLP